MNQILETKVEFVNTKNGDISCLKELYHLMSEYGIHRIYRVINHDKFYEAHQTLDVYINQESKIITSIILFIRKYIPIMYFKILLKLRIHGYRKKLKRIMKKYNIDTISANSFSLYQGIYTANKQLCISGVDFIFKCGKIYHIDKLYLDI